MAHLTRNDQYQKDKSSYAKEKRVPLPKHLSKEQEKYLYHALGDIPNDRRVPPEVLKVVNSMNRKRVSLRILKLQEEE